MSRVNALVAGKLVDQHSPQQRPDCSAVDKGFAQCVCVCTHAHSYAAST